MVFRRQRRREKKMARFSKYYETVRDAIYGRLRVKYARKLWIAGTDKLHDIREKQL